MPANPTNGGGKIDQLPARYWMVQEVKFIRMPRERKKVKFVYLKLKHPNTKHISSIHICPIKVFDAMSSIWFFPDLDFFPVCVLFSWMSTVILSICYFEMHWYILSLTVIDGPSTFGFISCWHFFLLSFQILGNEKWHAMAVIINR